MKSKKHCDFTRLDKENTRMQAREAYRDGSRRKPHSRSSHPTISGDGPLAGMARDVLAPAEELIPGGEARGLAKCDGLRRRRGR
jgi:hypothetical protein